MLWEVTKCLDLSSFYRKSQIKVSCMFLLIYQIKRERFAVFVFF